MFGRVALLASTLAILALGAALLGPPRAEAACTLAELCVETDSAGTANLKIPPLSTVALFKPEVKPIEDCVWEVVDVDFGDGSPAAVYFWDASKELTGTHTFPKPGEYHIHIDATKGHHGESKTIPPASCPDVPIEARAVFPSPIPPAEKPTEKTNEKTPTETPGKTGGGGGKKGGSGGSGGQAEVEDESGPSHPILVYKRCAKDIYAHRVACGEAGKVIAGAIEKLAKRHSAKVAGFHCSLDPDASRPISCRRGKSRVLGPLG